MCAIGWLKTATRLKDSRRERDILAKASHVIELEKRLLALLARGASLDELLDSVTRAIEAMEPGCICTVMLLDEESRTRLMRGSGPSISAEYMHAINGLEIGPDVVTLHSLQKVQMPHLFDTTCFVWCHRVPR
ncbi:MAG: hypothetical protein ABSH24_06030 [Bryobacteraceae bacterium]